jgi:hypothetical protein
MKNMTLTLVSLLALGCSSKSAEPNEFDYVPDADADSDADADADADADSDTDLDKDDDRDGFTPRDGDCDDGDDEIFPGADEECNGIDDDCDDRIDEGMATTRFYHDGDGDGYGDPNDKENACAQPEDHVENKDDCDDSDDEINPEGNEVSWDGMDQDCDGFDFTGEGCVDEALDLTMDWMASWAWLDFPDTNGEVYFHDYSFTDKVVTVNPNSTEASPGVDGVTVEVAIEADIEVQSVLTIDGFIVEQYCYTEVGPVPVLYTGTVELDVDGEIVEGTVELSHTVLASASSSTDYGDIPSTSEIESCELGLLDLVAGYLGYDITSFIDTDLEMAAQELGDKIENDLIEYDIPMACEPEAEPSEPVVDCDEGEIEDCNGNCALEIWIGDGWCDGVDEEFGAHFDCAEHDYDGGDCDAD